MSLDLQNIVNNAIAQSGGAKGSFLSDAKIPATSTKPPVQPNAPVVNNQPVDVSGFTSEQLNAFNNANQLGTGVQTIGATTLSEQPKLPNVPPQPQPDVPSIQSVLSQISTNTPEQDQVQGQQSSILSNIQNILTEQGSETARRGELEVTGGIPQLQKQLNEINQQITSITGESFAAQMKSEDRLAPMFAIQGEQAAIERQKAVRTFGLAAASQALQGNIALAQDNVERAIQSEFAPLESQLQFQTLLLDLNRDAMTSAEKKKADALQIMLGERQNQIATQKEEKRAISDVMLLAAKYQAGNDVLTAILNSGSEQEAIAIAGSAGALTNPTAQFEIEGMRLNNILAQERIATERAQRSLLGEPTSAELKQSITDIKEAKASIPVMFDKIAAVDTLKGHFGIKERVGANIFTRGTALPLIGDPNINTIGGGGQDFAGGIHKLVAGLSIESLLDAKARGATFGALSDTELQVLANSATAINDWEIKSFGKPTGYWNIDTASFNREMDNIKKLTARAIGLKQENLFTASEQELLNTVWEENGAFNPQGYFNK